MRVRTVFLSLFLLIPTIVVAENRDAQQSGEIVLEQDETRVESFGLTQDKSIQFFKDLQQKVEQGAAGTVPSANPEIDENALIYLNAAYHYCTVNAGTCPSLLDALLEADVINSRLKKQAQCPTLKAFWKEWVKNDMEKRLQYSVKTGFLADTEAFKKNERPKYIKCEPTVQAAIDGAGTDAEFFKARYSGDSTPKKATQRTVSILNEIKKRVGNVITWVQSR